RRDIHTLRPPARCTGRRDSQRGRCVDKVRLVEQAARGDRDAFGALMTDSLDGLSAIARLILRDPDLAEDAVQEALIHCWRELPRLRDTERFDGWLRRLLVTAATAQSRRRRRFHASA